MVWSFWLQNYFFFFLSLGDYGYAVKTHKICVLSSWINFKTILKHLWSFCRKYGFWQFAFKLPVKNETLIIFLIVASCRSHVNWITFLPFFSKTISHDYTAILNCYKIIFRPKTKYTSMCAFQPWKIHVWLVGIIILFYQNILYRNCIFHYIFQHIWQYFAQNSQ